MSTNIISILIEPADVSTNYFGDDVTGDTWTLTQNNISDLLAHKITILNNSATDHSGKTATIVGLDENNNSQTETLQLPVATETVTSTTYFKTVNSVTPSATIGADTMDIGYANAVMSRWIPLNTRGSRATTLGVTVTGVINYTAQQTTNPIQQTDFTPVWQDYDIADLVESTTNQTGNYGFTPSATKIKINSYDSGATLRYDVIEGRQDG